MEFIDYYKILEIPKTASAEDIKKSYRKLARKLHPDVNPNDKAAQVKFQQINEANEVLSDPEKRKKYDQYGKDWQHAEHFEKQKQQSRQRPGGAESFSSYGGEDFSDFFESMFGRQERSRSTGYRGQDFQAALVLPLEEAMHTHKQVLTINGKNIRITIPAGVENGQVIKLKGHGAPGINGGPSGDLYITFTIPPHPEFKRLGNDLYKEVTIDLYTALLGGHIIVPTLNGKIKLTVQPETQNATKIRLKGKGFPVYKNDGQFGDLFVTYMVELPRNLSEEQKELIRKLKETK